MARQGWHLRKGPAAFPRVGRDPGAPCPLQLRTRSDPPRVSAYRIKVLGICRVRGQQLPQLAQPSASMVRRSAGISRGGLQGHGRIVAGLTLTVVERAETPRLMMRSRSS